MVSDKKSVQDFVSLLVKHGVTDVVITPGSRNAPFIISLGNHPLITAHSVVDERSAAFIALGIAQQQDRIVGLICTSGTAALNFAPAIAEAYYQRIPLLVVTADRPVEWIDQGEGQSIRQFEVYRNYVKDSFEIAEDIGDGDIIWYNARLMDQAMRLCTEGVHGPVHINFPLRENLYRAVDGHDSTVKVVQRAHTELSLSADELNGLKDKIIRANKVMVLAGQMRPCELLKKYLNQFAQHKNVIVLTEAHSNLAHPDFITTIDRLIMGMEEEEQIQWMPELLITIGHNIISRKVKAFLRSAQIEHWHVDVSGEGLDTYKRLVKIIPLTPVAFFQTLSDLHYSSNSEYKTWMLQQQKATANNATEFMHHATWSDLAFFHQAMRQIPTGWDVQMGNSSVVRYILLSDARSDLNYFGNRGVAGIDGCTSTAIGAAYTTERPTVLITGDIAFFYDSNAFWNQLLPANLKIVVVNNSGGGIFRIIPGPHSTGDALGKFFETTHQRHADKLAEMYGINYRQAQDAQQAEDGLKWLFDQPTCAILEVCTPREVNDVEQKNFFRFLKENK